MPWTPGTALTSAAVRASTMEGDTNALWLEFLGGWFSGTAVVIAGVTVTPPSIPSSGAGRQISFQQAALVQPLDGGAAANASIGVIWLHPKQPQRRTTDHLTRTAFQPAQFKFIIRAAGQNKGDGGPEVLARKVGEMLWSILTNKGHTLPLARKGIAHVRAESPAPEASADYTIRSLMVATQLRCLVDLP